MPTKKPFITVYMPVYNAEAYLREAIDSIIRQTFTDFEFIIINDGSTDGSREIIDDYAARDSRIIVIHQENQGVVKTANKAIKMARGEYISRADADDVSFDYKLEELLSCAEKNPEAVVICGNIEVINRRGEFLYRDLVLPCTEDLKRAFYLRNPIPNGATLIKRAALSSVGGFDEVFAEDCHLWTKLFDKGDFIATGSTIYKWRTNPGGLTFTNLEKSQQKEKEYINLIWQSHPPTLVPRRFLVARSKFYLTAYPKIGKEYKLILLNEVSRVAVHRIKRGQLSQGLFQMVILASCGQDGLRAVLRRAAWVITGHLHAVRRRRQKPFSNSQDL